MLFRSTLRAQNASNIIFDFFHEDGRVCNLETTEFHDFLKFVFKTYCPCQYKKYHYYILVLIIRKHTGIADYRLDTISRRVHRNFMLILMSLRHEGSFDNRVCLDRFRRSFTVFCDLIDEINI